MGVGKGSHPGAATRVGKGKGTGAGGHARAGRKEGSTMGGAWGHAREGARDTWAWERQGYQCGRGGQRQGERRAVSKKGKS
jgi:hypothetical protein